MRYNSFSLNKFPQKVLDNIISAKKKRLKNINSNKISILKKSLSLIFTENFQGIALDFDGTLIPIKKRINHVDLNINAKLIDLNNRKIPIFILTGRGKSIFNQFPLNEFPFQEYILITQYNGARMLLGDKTFIFELNAKTFNEYETIHHFLKNNQIKFKENLAGFVCFDSISNYRLCASFISKFERWKVVSTSYSFDIFPLEITKSKALQKGSKLFNIQNINSILKIGDSGDINGNDYDYLKLKNSFSVGEYSSDLTTNFPIINEKNNPLNGPTGLNFILNHIVI